MVWLDEGGQQRDLGLIAARPALKDVVEHFWIQESLPGNVRRIVPDICPHVIFSTVDSPRGLAASCHVVGARSTYFDLNTTGRGLTIGARMRPGTLPLLLRDSAAILTDRRVSIEDVAARSAGRLVEQMVESRPHEAVESLGQFLAERFALTKAPHVDLVGGSVSELARTLHRSRRTAYNRCSSTVGLAPKLALRIHRLHNALFELNKGRSFADAAASAGYSDQAHFSRESVRLLGESPGAWRRRRNCSFVQDY